MRALLVSAVLILTACNSGVESQFTLTQDSRLPKWVMLPAGVRRDEVSVELSYRAGSDPRVRVLKEQWPFRKTLQDVTAKRFGDQTGPVKLDFPSSDPRYDFIYEVLVVGGVVDILEHPCPCLEVRMTDDGVVWAQLGPASR